MSAFENKVFVINKTKGPTSFEVVEAFRAASGIRKVGHTGTLDPLGEGVLILCTGKATRAVEHFMNLEKTYDFEVRLGIETSTLDAEGDVVREMPCPDIPERRIRSVAKEFIGPYELEPPAFSALKRDGRRMYELARAGEKPKVKTRLVTVYDMDVLDIDLPAVRLRLRCSRGTYVRALAKDFGAKLGLPAHTTKLVRVRIGPFSIDDGFPSERLFDGETSELEGVDLPRALDFLPAIVVRDDAIRGFLYGTLPDEKDVVRTVGNLDRDGAVRVMDERGRLIAVGMRCAGSERKRSNCIDSFRLFVDRQSLMT